MTRYFAFVLSVLLGASSYANLQLRMPRELDMPDEDIPVSHIFAPQGFDNEDNVEITARALKPSPCYETPTASFIQVNNQIIISMRAAKKFGNRICLGMVVPQMVTVSLGKMKTGDFEFFAANSAQAKAHMKIGIPKSESVDDYIYAHVENVLYNKETRTTSLIGRNPSDCVELDHIETQWNGVDTLAILPIMKQVKAQCDSVMVPFQYDYIIPETNKTDIELLHVRSLNGNAVNYPIYH